MLGESSRCEARAPGGIRGGGDVKLVTEEWRELEMAGWEPEECEGGIIWCNPNDGYWYDELRAIALLKEGVDLGGGC